MADKKIIDEIYSVGKSNLQIENKQAWKQWESMIIVLVVYYYF